MEQQTKSGDGYSASAKPDTVAAAASASEVYDFETMWLKASRERAALRASNAELVKTMELVASGLEADGRTADGITKATAAKKLRAALVVLP